MKIDHNDTSFYNFLTSPNSLFRHLTDEELESLPFGRAPEFHKRGTILYNEGSRISGFYWIQSGIIKIYKTGVDGKEQIIRFAKPCDIIGFRSVLSNELACTSAKVIEDSKNYFVPAENLIFLVKNNGNFSMDIIRLTCKELEEANSYITDIAQKTVRERLAEILIHLKNNFDLDKVNFLQINLTREELANMVGTATESVIRLLSEFKHDGIIELHGRKIKILDIKSLTRLASIF